ncbi:MAG: DUF1624 domain-containing protein [Bacteroidales bacterium]|nr:DUF1624 domain-containing protein [Bacteroidales bacterium]
MIYSSPIQTTMTQAIYKRQSIPDLLKGISVLLMIQVHLMELFATPSLLDSSLGKVSLFLGGPPAAPLFMIVMGYFISFSKGIIPLIKRGFQLIGLGLLLNLLLNTHLLIKIFTGKFILNPWEYIFGVDILFLAGISFLFIAGLYLLFRNKGILYLLTSVVIIISSTYIQPYLVTNNDLKYLLAYFGGNYTWSYFAFFPWVAYPLLGIAFKLLYHQLNGIIKAKKGELIITGALLLPLTLTSKWAIDVASNLQIYYHHDWLFFVWIISFTIVFTLSAKYIVLMFPQSNIVLFIKWIGKNVTAFYFIQWILIGNIATAIFKTQTLPQLLFWYISILTVCVFFIRYVMKKQFNKNSYKS